jgi:prepilin-type processing-associated H-X9-DG protein
MIQFCALKRGDTGQVHKLGNACDLKSHNGVLTCVRYAIITSSVVCLQRKQLSSTFTPLGYTLTRDNGTSIAFFDGHVVKTVDCSKTKMTDDQVRSLAELYLATQSNDHVVHASSIPRKTASTRAHVNGVYIVELRPLGKEAVRERLDTDRLCNAFRYTLYFSFLHMRECTPKHSVTGAGRIRRAVHLSTLCAVERCASLEAARR